MRFCEYKGCDQPVFGQDKTTLIGFCKRHQFARTDISKKSITQKAIERHKANPTTKITKPPRFIRPGTFDESVLNSEIIPVTPTPECYDGGKVDVGGLDEMDYFPSSFQNLVADLDQITSLLVRHTAANDKGEIKCFTCDRNITIKTAQCSHFIKRSNFSTRWLLLNLSACCVTCNEFMGGNLIKYETRIGKDVADYLRELSKQVHKPTQSDLKELIIEYRNKFELVKKK